MEINKSHNIYLQVSQISPSDYQKKHKISYRYLSFNCIKHYPGVCVGEVRGVIENIGTFRQKITIFFANSF